MLKVPGKHNVMNALAAAVACFELGVSARDIANGLGEFTGAHRRFEILGTEGGITVADDFAHHRQSFVQLSLPLWKWAIKCLGCISATYIFKNCYAS